MNKKLIERMEQWERACRPNDYSDREMQLLDLEILRLARQRLKDEMQALKTETELSIEIQCGAV